MVRSGVNLASKFLKDKRFKPQCKLRSCSGNSGVWGFAVVCLPDSRARSHSQISRGFLVWLLEVDHLDNEGLQVNNGKYSRFRN